MNIGSVGASSALEYVRKLSGASTSSGSSQVESADSDSVKLSKPAEMFKKLEALQESAPAKFKEVVSQISDQLNEAAQSATGADQQRLSDMASKFAEAAESGDVSALKPPSGGGERPPPPAIAAYKRQQEPSGVFKTAMDSAFSLVDQA